MRTRNLFAPILMSILTCFLCQNAEAQKLDQDRQKTKAYKTNKNKSSQRFDEIERIQDSVEILYLAVYEIMNRYPNADYSYMYNEENGIVDSVIVTGISDQPDKELLEVYLVDLVDLKSNLTNLPNRLGVYYFAEEEARPKVGFDDYYQRLQEKLDYPEEARSEGVTGTIFAKFIVDPRGEIDTVFTSDNIDTPYQWVVEDLELEVKKAVINSSGAWNPAKVGGIPVAQWVVLPVQFRFIDTHYGLVY